MKKEKNKKAAGIVRGFVIMALAAGIIMFVVNRPVKFRMVSIVSGRIQDRIETTGIIESKEKRTYYAQFTAPVAKFSAKEGRMANEGELLVVFDTGELSTAAKQSALTVKSLSQQYQAAANQNSKNSGILLGATTSIEVLEQQIADQIENIRDLQERITKADMKANDIAVLTNRISMEPDQDNKEKLQKTLDVWKKEYIDFDVDKLSGDLGAQQTILNKLMTSKSEYEAQKQAADSSLIDSASLEQTKAARASAGLDVLRLEEDLEEAELGIRADYKGIITEVFIEEGVVAGKGEPLFTLEKDSELTVQAGINKYDINKIKQGQKAEIEIAGHIYLGSVSNIDRIARKEDSDKAKIYVEITLDQPDENSYLGMDTEVTVLAETKDNALLIPLEAVYEDENGSYCYGLEEGRVIRKDIELGLKEEGVTEVLKGLKAGDRVILDAVKESEIGRKAVERK